MGQMYAWATKEYILWEMSLTQLIMYHNYGIEEKDPQPGDRGLRGKTKEEREETIKEIKRLAKEKRESDELARSESAKEVYRKKYGNI